MDHGQRNIKGINAQAWAAFSLFLQYWRTPGFTHMQLEAPGMQDFVLKFKDGHKIICESKSYKRNFSYSHLKKVISSINKNNSLNQNDEVIIVVESIDDKIDFLLKSKPFIAPHRINELKKKRFTSDDIKILKQSNIWVTNKTYNIDIVNSLFTELLDFWLPQEAINNIIKSVLVDKIYNTSENGGKISKDDILELINELKIKSITDSGYLDQRNRELEIILEDLKSAVKNSKCPVWAPSQLAALSSQPNIMYYVLDIMKKQSDIILSDWDKLWEIACTNNFEYMIFDVFKQNITTYQNKNYIINFVEKNIKRFHKYYTGSFFRYEVLNLIRQLVDIDNIELASLFNVLVLIFQNSVRENFYIITDSRNDETSSIADLCHTLQKIFNNADPKLQTSIIEYVFSNFNLISDSGEHSQNTPRSIFEIINHWLSIDIEKRLEILSKVVSKQYDNHYRVLTNNKIRFDGWEHEGGISVGWGRKHRCNDKHFVEHAMKPALERYYEEHKIRAMRFIHSKCITQPSHVCKNKPDFLNRSILSILLRDYLKKPTKVKFSLINDFILSKQGLPHKADLIYQELSEVDCISNRIKIKFLKITSDKYINLYAENIVLSLSQKGNIEAKQILKKWLSNPDLKYYHMHWFSFKDCIKPFIIKDYNFALELYNEFINSKYFIKDYDEFDVYEIAEILHKIHCKDIDKGQEIIKQILSHDQLSQNQQILICYSLYSNDESKSPETKQILLQIFHEIVQDLILKDRTLNDLMKIFPLCNSRESLVQFSSRLAKHDLYEEALAMVRFFINDTDPVVPKMRSLIKTEHNEHINILKGQQPLTITSVRGQCAWVLMQCISIHARCFLPEIITLTSKLMDDKNLYIVHMASFPLAQLITNRLSHMPNEPQNLFLNDNRIKALNMSKHIEKLAFQLLQRISNSTHNIKIALGTDVIRIFGNIKALNKKDSLELISCLRKFPDKIRAEAAPIIIYLALYRKNMFCNWTLFEDGFYDDLHPQDYDDKVFIKFLKEQLTSLKAENKSRFAWQFHNYITNNNTESKDYEEGSKLALKYLDFMASKYDSEVFDVIYKTILFILKNDIQINDWYKLLDKCLENEKKYYGHLSLKKRKTLHATYYKIDNIFELVYDKLGKECFLDAIKLYFSFPEGIVVFPSERILELLATYPNTNSDVKKIFTKLVRISPSNYYSKKLHWENKEE